MAASAATLAPGPTAPILSALKMMTKAKTKTKTKDQKPMYSFCSEDDLNVGNVRVK